MFSRSNIQEVLPTSHRCAQEHSMWKESNYVGGYTYKMVFLHPGWTHSTHLHPFHIEELDKGEEEKKKITFKDSWALMLFFGWLSSKHFTSPKDLLQQTPLETSTNRSNPAILGPSHRFLLTSTPSPMQAVHQDWREEAVSRRKVRGPPPHTPSSLIDRRDFLGDFKLETKQ